MTNSTRAGVRGVQHPLVASVPPGDDSDADDAIFLASRYGLTPDPWQEFVLRSWLSRKRDGRWSASRCGLALPRQNGKNALLEIRELFGVVVLGEKWLHTAHEVKTARKAFIRLSSFFENPREFPELADLVADVRKTNGQEAIVLTNGGSVEFVARSKGSARGFTVDCLAIDEAQELGDEALEALVPTTSAGPARNPQWIFTGTPPGPKANGEVFTRTRAAGKGGKDRSLSWIEWGAPKDANLDDREAWAQANPALGFRLSLSVIEEERKTFDDTGFARERLGQWDEFDESALLTVAAWLALASDGADARSMRPVFAIDVAPHHASASIVAVGSAVVPVVELVDQRPGASWLVPRLREVVDRHGGTVALNSAGPVGSLIPELGDMPFTDVHGGDYTKACGLFVATVNDAGLLHRSDPGFAQAIAGAKTRTSGDGFTWARTTSQVDITPLVAGTVGLWATVATRAPLTSEQLLSTFL